MRCRGELTESGAGPPGQLEDEGACGPRLYSFNNNHSFSLPWSTVWTLSAESRCTFQLPEASAARCVGVSVACSYAVL